MTNNHSLPFNFAFPGATENAPPLPKPLQKDWWAIDHRKTRLGKGKRDYDRAVKLLKGWEHFKLPWTWVNAPKVQKDNPVVVTAQTLFLWSMQPLKVTYVKETRPSKGGKEFSFAHTTLKGHQLKGEERFAITWNGEKDGPVVYSILTISKPATVLAHMSYPIVRFYQAKFGADSSRKMEGAMNR